MEWTIRINKSAKKYLEKIDSRKKNNFLVYIKELKNWVENREQAVLDIKALKGQWEGRFRLRIGNIRVIFRIVPVERQIKILYIGPRGDAYK
ncbi:MAG: type II toxin-antitoxin system RelE/ParE family toxin [Candidatus Aminicenantes bacterium]|nr:type II toxin-antitoxin system RelE/ParE family toxin [Candidatus Aminicenantes bacterium]